jgi:hypothetical protein
MSWKYDGVHGAFSLNGYNDTGVSNINLRIEAIFRFNFHGGGINQARNSVA